MIGAAMMMAIAAAPLRYDCGMEVPKAVARDGSKATLQGIGFPDASPEGWHFVLALEHGESEGELAATITWPGNPIQLAGKHAALPTTPDSFAFSALSGGPCMFSENICVTLVNMVRQPDKSFKFVVLPAAVSTDEQHKNSSPFIVIAEGSCKEIKG